MGGLTILKRYVRLGLVVGEMEVILFSCVG